MSEALTAVGVIKRNKFPCLIYFELPTNSVFLSVSRISQNYSSCRIWIRSRRLDGIDVTKTKGQC